MNYLDFDKLKKLIETHANNDINNADLTDAVIGVYQEGRETVQSFGKARRDSMFRLASMTKPITAISAGIAIEQGKISLDDEVAKYLPAYKNMPVKNSTETGTPLIKHILTHSSGISSSDDFLKQEERFNATPNHTSLKDVAEFYAHEPLDFVPGKAQYYSPLVGLDILCRIIELVYDKPYEEWVKQNIFDPCEMPDTTYEPTEEQWQRMVNVSGKKDNLPTVEPNYERAVFDNNKGRHYCGTAGLASTYDDYINFCKMLLNEGEYKGKRIVSQDWIRTIAQKHLPPEIMGDPVVWGYCVRVITSDAYETLPVGCYGWSGAFGSHFWIDPANRIAAVYMKNCTNDGGAGSRTAVNFERDVFESLQ